MTSSGQPQSAARASRGSSSQPFWFRLSTRKIPASITSGASSSTFSWERT